MMFSSRSAGRRHPQRWLRAALVLLLGVVPLAHAQEGGEAPPLPAADLQAIASFPLNEDVLHRLMAVVKEGHALGIHPNQPSQNGGAYTLDNIAAQAVSADPRIAPLLARYGFTPRQFLLTNMAMSAAAIAVQAKQHPELAGYVDPSRVNPANVAFYQAHLPEITSFLRAQQGGDTAPGDAANGVPPSPGQ
ncbi:hypothetical protein ACYJW8_03390 [Frateuria aurantia]